jgi:hypothetical protein
MNKESMEAAKLVVKNDNCEGEGALGHADISWISEAIDPVIEPLAAKLKTAMELLAIAEKEMEGQPIMGTDYWRRYYALTGQHMILTEEGWESGQSKQTYIEQAYEDQCPINEVILDEVNAP